MNAKAAVDLLRKVGLFGLAESDGCLCMSFAVQGVTIDVACRKSTGCFVPGTPDFRGLVIRSHSRNLDTDLPGLRSVADEVAAQLGEEGCEIAIRLCDYRMDKDVLCCYCEKPRTDVAGYFCDKHLGRSNV